MNTDKITLNQIKCIGAICSKLRITADEKETIVAGFSNGREVSSKFLTYMEAILMIRHLQELQSGDDECSKMKGKIFYYAHEMNWTKKNYAGKVVADGKIIDQWMISYSYLKKKLNQYTYSELPKLVSQFEMVYKQFLSKI